MLCLTPAVTAFNVTSNLILRASRWTSRVRCRYSFNDEQVSKLAPSAVQTANAYILFYKKRE